MPTQGQKALAKKQSAKVAKTPDKTVKQPAELAEKKGMGFSKAAAAVSKSQGIPASNARAIIAAGAQKASAKAKKANPNLKKVPTKGSKKQAGGGYR